ncbi:TPA: hypothetical protein I7203_09700 [Vibrio vulnificus]|uniref:Uncharacterized protein n=1 Tax=Vibrio vulnificus (strain CMCP6) TaxID=216895 RepID=A0A3Q0MFI1_VIBVU|nr:MULTISPECIES: hypothetical protein [Vibrio]OJI60730.1 hypothetical protein VFL11327_00473 [Vibrio fluvialis]ADV87047.1 hypothetical protein VVMO6_02025 [Vibrio vulnificus MO6-24/O]ADV91965.1 Hypothetical protein VV1_3251 [Vibrio vulnificus CMCP6]AUJ34642.1 hypothetical protein BWZ32_06960 [Vibrio vulnificus]EGQ7697770.1 hypothetical protein [Vibrio vulnificus]
MKEKNKKWGKDVDDKNVIFADGAMIGRRRISELKLISQKNVMKWLTLFNNKKWSLSPDSLG